ncbi:MAG TPA: carboxymuconolactone decarboxylase family protein [Bryobacteraceae bacterium]
MTETDRAFYYKGARQTCLSHPEALYEHKDRAVYFTRIGIGPRTGTADTGEGPKGFSLHSQPYGTFANSPALLEAYMALDAAFEKTRLSPTERQLVLLAVSVENACRYCTAAHSTVLKQFLRVPPEVVAAVRSGSPVSDHKLNVLVNLTREIVSARGYVDQQTIDSFLAASYQKEQVLEVLIGVALKTISNYTDHLSPNEVDKAFAAER